MSYVLKIEVKETMEQLRKLLKTASLMIQPRLKMLIAIKKSGGEGISKRALMESIGVCSQSIQNWRTAYLKSGLEALLTNGRKGKSGKPPLFTKEEFAKLEKKLNDPKNGLAGYIELQEWISKEFNKEIKYNTILKFSIRHFGTKVKVARKSHVKKDEKAVGTFKKTSSRK
jgi:transposase